MIIPIDDEPTNVICLSEARARFAIGKCQHKRVEVDELLAEVTCRDCGEKLNPIAVMVRMAQEESRLGRRIAELKQLQVDLEKKQRTICKHCGRTTPVRPTR